MRLPDESAGLSRARYWFVLILFFVLLALAAGAAWISFRTQGAPPPPLPAPPLSINYHRVIFTIWVTIALLTPALSFFIFARSGARNTYWRAFWTAAYLALFAHLYWAIFGVCGRDLPGIFYGTFTEVRPECIVEHPWPDLFLGAWWGLDVVLAWLALAWVALDNVKWVQVQRGAVHFLAFVMFFGAFVFAEKAGVVAHLLGILMALLVVGCFALRIILREGDPKSLGNELYVRTFQLLNLFVVWHKLPTWLAVLNLGALRDVLRAKNLHNTSDIRVSEQDGVWPRTIPPLEARYLSERQEDGQYNDLAKPTTGNASFTPEPFDGSAFTKSNPGARFGRNIPLSEVDPERDGGILDPNPRRNSKNCEARSRRWSGGRAGSRGGLTLRDAARKVRLCSTPRIEKTRARQTRNSSE